ncbi:MAG TPA: hypothetical protein VKA31_08440 [Mariprofundaceae bacterium]|nr:hypothetical protein [Mariprofundaceae bacterium]
MRTLAFILTLALQLSVFTCGIEVHADEAPGNSSPTGCQVQHQHDNPNPAAPDLGCELHAAHVFTAEDIYSVTVDAPISEKVTPTLAALSLKNILPYIDHPPSILHS